MKAKHKDIGKDSLQDAILDRDIFQPGWAAGMIDPQNPKPEQVGLGRYLADGRFVFVTIKDLVLIKSADDRTLFYKQVRSVKEVDDVLDYRGDSSSSCPEELFADMSSPVSRSRVKVNIIENDGEVALGVDLQTGKGVTFKRTDTPGGTREAFLSDLAAGTIFSTTRVTTTTAEAKQEVMRRMLDDARKHNGTPKARKEPAAA